MAVDVGAEHEHLGDEGPDPLRREVDDAHDLAAHQVFGPVPIGDLSARPPLPERTEIDPEPVRRLPGLRERLGPHDGADPHVHTLKVAPGDLAHGMSGSSGAAPGRLSPQGRQGRARIVVLEDLRIQRIRGRPCPWRRTGTGPRHAPSPRPSNRTAPSWATGTKSVLFSASYPISRRKSAPRRVAVPRECSTASRATRNEGLRSSIGQPGHLPHVEPAPAEPLPDHGERQAHGPGVVRRLHGELVANAVERRDRRRPRRRSAPPR